MSERRCVDCENEGVRTNRPAPYGGPRSARCATHYRALRKRRKARAHALRVENNFGITADEYATLYESQGGVCFICRVARGVVKKLAVDHDHNKCDDHEPQVGCRNCVRSLLCGPCNQAIGRLNVAALKRAIEVLTNPPAQRILNP